MANEIKQRDKPEMIRKIFRAKIKSVDKEKFIVNAVVSDDSMDRYKESILATRMKNDAQRINNIQFYLALINTTSLFVK